MMGGRGRGGFLFISGRRSWGTAGSSAQPTVLPWAPSSTPRGFVPPSKAAVVRKRIWESPSFVLFPAVSPQHHSGKSEMVEEKEKKKKGEKIYTPCQPPTSQRMWGLRQCFPHRVRSSVWSYSLRGEHANSAARGSHQPGLPGAAPGDAS